MREAGDISVPELRFPEFSGEWEFEPTSGARVLRKFHHGIVQAGPHVNGGMPYIKSQNLSGKLDMGLPYNGLQRVIAAKYQ